MNNNKNTNPDPSSIWKTTRPGPQFVRAGERWSFRLPLTGERRTPLCHWSSQILTEGSYSVSDDTLTLTADIPSDLTGICKIHYRVDIKPPLDGFILLNIISSSEPRGRETSDIIDKKDSTDSPKPDDIKKALHETRPEIRRCAYNIRGRTSSEPMPRGYYFISIFRENIPVPELRTPVFPHKSILAGKFSRSRNIHPDIDLKAHFPTKKHARLCSRKQAGIYWSEDRIMVKNLGKADLIIAGRMPVKSGETCLWNEGEKIIIPGGLTFILEREK